MMRRRAVVALAAVIAAFSVLSLAGTGAVASAGSPQAGRAIAPVIGWGKAEEVPGLAALNAGGNAQVTSLSCAPDGGCAAGGFYTDAAGHKQAFVVSQVKGKWGSAREVPGTAALNASGSAQVNSVSCGSAGDCAAGGTYDDANQQTQAFVVSELNGAWHSATEVPGTAALNIGGLASTLSVSCAKGGDCAASGFYQGYNGPGSGPNDYQAFVVSSFGGRWSRAEEVPGIAPLNINYEAMTVSVSCPSEGNCSAGGFYWGALVPETSISIPFVVSEKSGRWGYVDVPSGLLTRKYGGSISAVSCSSSGNCGAGGTVEFGTYTNSSAALVVSQRNGVWGKAQAIAGTSNLSGASVNSMSCPRAGDCTAVGIYGGSADGYTTGAFIAVESNGRWGRALLKPGLVSDAGTLAVSCAAPGNCGAGGYYQYGQDSFGNPQWAGFVLGERNGHWSAARVPAGLAALNAGNGAQVSGVSCPFVATCVAGGYYTDGAGHTQGFVDQ